LATSVRACRARDHAAASLTLNVNEIPDGNPRARTRPDATAAHTTRDVTPSAIAIRSPLADHTRSDSLLHLGGAGAGAGS